LLLALTALGQLVLVLAETMTWAAFGVYLTSVAMVWLASAWLVFAILYTGRERHLTSRRIAGLIAVPVALSAAVVTGGIHGQTLVDPVFVATTDGASLEFTAWGVTSWAAGLYSWGTSAVAIKFLLDKFLTSRNVYRKISFMHVGGGTIFNLGGILSFTGVSPLPHVSLAPAAFSVVIVASAPTVLTYRYLQVLPLDRVLSVFGNRFQSLTPMARDTIMQNMDSGVLVVDHGNRIVDINPLGRRMISAQNRRVVGKPVQEVIPPTMFEGEDTGFLEATTVDATYRGIWTSSVADRQRCFDVQITAFGASDDPAGRVALINDVTEREIRKNRLEQRTSELERQNEQLEQFAGVVSHDLRNPLTVAKGYLDGAQDVADDGELLAEAEQSLDRMEAIINDVLALAREGQSIGETEAVELSEIATAAWKNVDTPAATLVVANDGTFEADSDRLLNLFENLFRNAVEHGATASQPRSDGGPENDGASVTVTVGWEGSGFYVADDGPGIPDGEREDVLSFGYTTADSGTGFGLSIVEQVADAHGWSVEVGESESGGARFSFPDVETDHLRARADTSTD
jgi:signal transduction histidine kinase